MPKHKGMQTRPYISYAKPYSLHTYEGEVNIDLTHQVMHYMHIHVNLQTHLLIFSEKTNHVGFTR